MVVQDNNVLRLRPKGISEYVGVLRKIDGRKPLIITHDGWMLVQHSKGLLGLPILGDTGSWYAAWNDECIQIDVCVPGEWVTIEDWNELTPLLACV